jgi:hypothetical protein
MGDRLGRKTVVEVHPKRLEIEKELGEGLAIRSISRKYGISQQALIGYKRNRLPERVVKAVEKRNITDAQQLFEVILKAVQRMEKLSDACDSWLEDPDKAGEYFMGPRAGEVKIVYQEMVEKRDKEGKVVKITWEKHKAKLQDLLNRVAEVGVHRVVSISSPETDPRILLVKSSEVLTKQMETLVNAWKSVDQGRSSFIGTPAWDQVVSVILKATERDPQMRREIADGLGKITG